MATLWTTKSVNETIHKIRSGYDHIDLSAFHERKIDLKGYEVSFQLTKEEENEFIKCSNNIEYFVETYCKFLTDKGLTTVTLRDFQRDILNVIGEEQWFEELDLFGPVIDNYILMASRQTGKTTTIAAFFSWYLCFHTDRNMAILANKEATTKEIVRKVIDVFKGLPFFLKPGIENIGKMGLRLDNGCMLTSQSTTATSSLGFTIHVLYIDEFAHIHPNITGEFWRSVYPTLASSDISQCIISSTPNGYDNLFYEIWDKANRGKNTFGYKRVDWWEVPEHDDAWAKKLISNFGEEYFAQEFELKFDITTNNLLAGSDLTWMKRLSDLQGKYKYQELEQTILDDGLYENLKFRQDFDINKDFTEETDRFLISIDLAEGKDEDEVKDTDYNIANILKVKLKSLPQLRQLRQDQLQIENMFRIEQIGLYRDNVKDEKDLAKVCQSLVFDQLGEDLVKLIVEMNFNGKAFTNKFSEHEKFYDGILMRSWHTAPVLGQKPPRKKVGFKVRQDKDHYVKAGKKLIHNKTILVNEEETYSEFSSFGRVKKKWAGIGKHDDIVMATLNISRIFDEEEYKGWLYDFLEILPDSAQKQFVLLLLLEPATTSDINDDMFNAMYIDEVLTEKERIQGIFTKHEKNKNRYSPSSSQLYI